jgi:hypothetical protein
MGQAFELVQLICDIEQEPKEDSEFFLVYRKDCPLWVPKKFHELARKKFKRSAARMARNHDTGWPAGSNMLAASSFIEMSLLRREGLCKNTGFLLFEPDCVPLSKDWLERLSAEWDQVVASGKEAFGHWHYGGPPELHLNGNAVFRTSFFDEHPTWIVGAGTQGWDYFFRERFLPISVDSPLILQHWQRFGISEEEFQALEKQGVHPAFFHGEKTGAARTHARKLLT